MVITPDNDPGHPSTFPANQKFPLRKMTNRKTAGRKYLSSASTLPDPIDRATYCTPCPFRSISRDSPCCPSCYPFAVREPLSHILQGRCPGWILGATATTTWRHHLCRFIVTTAPADGITMTWEAKCKGENCGGIGSAAAPRLDNYGARKKGRRGLREAWRFL